MNSIVFVRVMIMALAILSACEDNDREIVYPKTGHFGENLLQADSVDVISSGNLGGKKTSYCIKAELPEKTAVRLIITHKSDNYGLLFYDTNTRLGWSMDQVTYDTDSGTFHFYGDGPIVCDVRVYFVSSGSAEIAIYENGDTIPARIKTFSWDN